MPSEQNQEVITVKEGNERFLALVMKSFIFIK
jgi:hypothetical protein